MEDTTGGTSAEAKRGKSQIVTGTAKKSAKPSRPVTVRCAAADCRNRFVPRRKDALYCSGACRQRKHRAAASTTDIDRAIERARVAYWALVLEKALKLGYPRNKVLSEESQYIDLDGNVYFGPLGKPVRHAGNQGKPPRHLGWHSWGLEAAGPPWCAPPSGPRT